MPGRLPPHRLRPAVVADVDACVDVFHRSYESLQAARHEPLQPRNSPPLRKLFTHLVSHDPDGAWVATRAGSDEVVGFALSNRRGDRWFLSFLFVLEAWQAGGLGRELLRAALPDDPGAWRLGVCAEAIQPISTALYARHGMSPRSPIYLLAGELRPDAVPRDADRLAATPFSALDADTPSVPGGGAPLGGALLARLAAIDRELGGVERPQDHQLCRTTGRLGLLFHPPGAPDQADGYGYVQPAGRIGPVLVREPWMLQPALGELTGALEPMIAWQAVVPGIAAHALRPLLEGGLRIEGSPAVYAANWSGPPFERYLPMSFGLV